MQILPAPMQDNDDKLNTMQDHSYDNIQLCIKALHTLLQDEMHRKSPKMCADEWFLWGSELGRIANIKTQLESIIYAKNYVDNIGGQDENVK